MSHGFSRIFTDQPRWSSVNSLVMDAKPPGLRATDLEVGLLLNFGLRPQFRRLLFDNQRKKIGENPCESVAKVPA